MTVKCTIDEKGNVTEPEVEKSSNAAFEKPAIAALKKWKFKPAEVDGAPVASKVSIPIKFVFESYAEGPFSPPILLWPRQTHEKRYDW